MDKAVEIIITKLKAKGVADAEKVCSDVFGAIQEAAPEIAVAPECSDLEKSTAGVAVLVLGALKPAIDKLIDFNHDGKIG